MSDFNKVEIVRKCCFSILPQVYWDRLTITEQVAKIIDGLNKLIENNNNLEDYIKEIIQEVIENGEIENILEDMLANYILNVKFPPNGITPAVGDGTKDDTESLQGCINYAFEKGGMAVFIPSGSYLIDSLDIKNKVSMVGFSRENTRLVLKGGATRPLINGNIENSGFYNISFDANSENQVNIVNLLDITIANGSMFNLFLKGGNISLNTNVSKLLQINNIIFDSSNTHNAFFMGNGQIQANNLMFNNVSPLNQQSAITIDVSNSRFDLVSKVAINTPIVIHGNNNSINATVINNVNAPIYDSGSNNTYIITNQLINEYLSGDKTSNINNLNENIRGNKVTHSNESVENVIEQKTVNAKNSVEIIGQNKTLTADNFTENITKELNITAETINETAFSKNLNIADNLTLTSPDLTISTANPIGYKKPVKNNSYFDYIPFKNNNQTYRVLVKNNLTDSLTSGVKNIKEYGAFGDGIMHPVSEMYSSLSDAKNEFPFIESLTDSFDWACIQKALNENFKTYIPSGEYIIEKPLVIRGYSNVVGDKGAYPVINSTTLERKAMGTVIKKIKDYGATGLSSYNREGVSINLSNIDAIFIVTKGNIWNYETWNGGISDICIVSDYTRNNFSTGVYSFRNSSSTFENIMCYNCFYGYNAYDSFKNNIINFNALDCKVCGIHINTTSNCLTNCYVVGASVGYYIEAMYQTLTNCACDYATDIAYYFKNAQGCIMSGCGQEMCSGNKIRCDHSDSITIDGCFASGNTSLSQLILPAYSQNEITQPLPAERDFTIVAKDYTNIKFNNTLFRSDATKNTPDKQLLYDSTSNIVLSNTVIGRKDWNDYSFIQDTTLGASASGISGDLAINDVISGKYNKATVGVLTYLNAQFYYTGIVGAPTDTFIIELKNLWNSSGVPFKDLITFESTLNNTSNPASTYSPITLCSGENTAITHRGGFNYVNKKLYFINTATGNVLTKQEAFDFGGINHLLTFYGVIANNIKLYN